VKSLGRWVEKQGERTAEQALSLLRAQPGAAMAVPLPFRDRSEVHAKIGDLELNEKIRAAPVKVVSVAGLVAIQHTVDKARVEEYLRDPGMDSRPGAMNPKSGTPVDYPVVVRLGKHRYLWDGNHRAIASILRGAGRVPARYVDLGP
jgi:hypothetical protein